MSAMVSLAVGLAVGVATVLALWPPSPWPWRLTGSEPAETTARTDPVGGRLRRRPPDRIGPRRAIAGRAEDPGPGAVVEMLMVSLSAGMGLHQGLLATAAAQQDRSPLAAAAGALRRGEPLADALDGLAEHGQQWAALATTLAVTSTSGAPVLPELRRLGTSERQRHRRAVEERVRRLPVLLLVPLVGLVLPAFALVSFVPLVVALAGNLR